MIKNLPLLILIFCGFIGFAQVKSTEIKDYNLMYALNNIDTVMIRSNNEIYVRLYKISNPFGSAHMPETDEISNRYLIAVSEPDDAPEQHLYNVGDFLAPKILKFQGTKDDHFNVIIEYGIYKKRKKVSVDISLKKVTVTPV